MRIIRYVLSALFLLLTLAGGVVIYGLFFVIDQRLVRINNFYGTGIDVHWGYVAIGATVFMLLLTILTLPSGSKRKPKAVKQKKFGLSAQDARKLIQLQKEQTLAESAPAEDLAIPDEAGTVNVIDTEGYSGTDPEAMRRLVAIDQGEITKDTIKTLLTEYYPDLLELSERIREGDNLTTEAIGRHIISIGRFRLKLTEKDLTDNQFSIFQNKVFDTEKEEFLQIYKPEAVDNLNDEQKSYVGMVLDKRAWEKAQRVVMGKREEWKQLSIVNAAELLKND